MQPKYGEINLEVKRIDLRGDYDLLIIREKPVNRINFCLD